jgi:hypothetical protein
VERIKILMIIRVKKLELMKILFITHLSTFGSTIDFDPENYGF